VSIWTVRFDAVSGQRLRLSKNATAFFGLSGGKSNGTWKEDKTHKLRIMRGLSGQDGTRVPDAGPASFAGGY